MKNSGLLCVALAVAACSATDSSSPANSSETSVNANPPPSWNEGPSRAAIVDFVQRATTPGSPDFIPVPERIATFDNDGCLWSEQPAYFQLAFAIDRSKMLAAHNPKLAENPVLKALASGDERALAAVTEHDLVELVAATHSGMTLEEFQDIVANWFAVARHPRFNVPYSQLIYLPMLELLDYLRANEFKTFIVSGGGVDFLRVFAEQAYGIPPEQVVGSMGDTEFEIRDGKPVLIKQPGINFVDDKEGKPVGIARFIGRRPVFAFGNVGPPQALQGGGWVYLNREVWSKDRRRDADQQTDQRQGDLQVTTEANHQELKVWDAAGSQWLPVYSRDAIDSAIAAMSLFEGTVNEVGGGAIGALDLDTLPNVDAMSQVDDPHATPGPGGGGAPAHGAGARARAGGAGAGARARGGGAASGARAGDAGVRGVGTGSRRSEGGVGGGGRGGEARRGHSGAGGARAAGAGGDGGRPDLS